MTCGDDKDLKFWGTSNWNAYSFSKYQLRRDLRTCEFGDDGMKIGAGDKFADARPPSFNNGNGNRYYELNSGDYNDFVAARIRPNSQYAIFATESGKMFEV